MPVKRLERLTLEDMDAELAKAKDMVQLSTICRNLEERLDATRAPLAVKAEFERLAEKHTKRIAGSIIAG